MEYSIQQIAKAAGVTSRTLRHYDEVGLLAPSRVGHNGYRYYDDRSLVRLQRVLLLRELGLGLDAIGQVLAVQDAQAAGTGGTGSAGGTGDAGPAEASGSAGRPAEAEALILTSHLELLQQEQRRIETQIGSVERTIAALRRPRRPLSGETPRTTEGEGLMSENMFDGFDHTQHREEVEQRWGADAYAKSDRWWRSMSKEEQAEWQQRVAQLSADWAAAAERGADPESAEAQDLARRHVEWLRGIEGTPAWEETRSVSAPGSARPLLRPASILGGDLAGYVLGLAEMYVADERFAANYGGVEGATFVRDALKAYVACELG